MTASELYGFTHGSLPEGYQFDDDGAVVHAPALAREAHAAARDLDAVADAYEELHALSISA